MSSRDQAALGGACKKSSPFRLVLARGIARASAARLDLWIVWGVLAVVAFGLQWLGYGALNQPDHFVYTQVARRWLDGGKLYQDVILDKPPGLVLWYSIPHLLMPRSLGGLFAAVVGALSVQAATIILVLKPRLLPAIVSMTALMLIPSSVYDWRWLSTEHLSNVILTGILASCVAARCGGTISPRWAFCQGVLVGVAFLTRPPVATFLLVPWITILCLPETWQRKSFLLAVVAAGAAAAGLLSVAFVGLQGSISGYLHVLFVFPRLYADQGNFTGGWFLEFAAACGFLHILLPAIVIAMISPARGPLLAALVAGVVSVVSPRREFGHYLLTLMPFITVTMAVSVAPEWWPANFRRRGSLATTSGAVLIIACSMAIVLVTSWVRDYPAAQEERKTRSLWMDLVAAIDRAVTKRDATLWVVGPMGLERIAFLSTLRQPYPVANSWELELDPFRELWGSREEVFAECTSAPPNVVVVANQFVPGADDPAREKKLAAAIVERLREQYLYIQIWSAGDVIALVRQDIESTPRDSATHDSSAEPAGGG